MVSFLYKWRRKIAHSPLAPFIPQFVSSFFEGFSKRQLISDALAGLNLCAVGFPLALALAIGAGVDPEIGLYTAIVAAVVNSLLSGSRFVVGAPTGSFIIMVFSVVQRYGTAGLGCMMVQAALILLLLGVLRCGKFVRFISFPVIVGFTIGIAITLFVSQLRGFFGLSIPDGALDVVGRLHNVWKYIGTINWYDGSIGLMAMCVIVLFQIYLPRFPGVVVALALVTSVSYLCSFPVATIESSFGPIAHTIPLPKLPVFSLSLIQQTFPYALGVAILAAVESLLCTVTLDNLMGTKHRSDCELIAQGVTNLGISFFGGIPATASLVRSTAAIQLKGASPWVGIFHGIGLLGLTCLFAPLTRRIPVSALSTVLMVVAARMLQRNHIKMLWHGQIGETIVMLTTAFVTVFIDLKTAIQVGVFISIILFLKKSSESTRGQLVPATDHSWAYHHRSITVAEERSTKVYEIEGPFFFAVSDLLVNLLSYFHPLPKKLILRLRHVPFVDSTAVNALKQFVNTCEDRGVELFLAELNPQVRESLDQFDFFSHFPEDHVLIAVDQGFL